MAVNAANECLKLLPALKQLHEGSVWVSYDAEADVLYVSFRMPNVAESTDEIEHDILERRNPEGKVIGYTILNATRHGYRPDQA